MSKNITGNTLEIRLHIPNSKSKTGSIPDAARRFDSKKQSAIRWYDLQSCIESLAFIMTSLAETITVATDAMTIIHRLYSQCRCRLKNAFILNGSDLELIGIIYKCSIKVLDCDRLLFLLTSGLICKIVLITVSFLIGVYFNFYLIYKFTNKNRLQ